MGATKLPENVDLAFWKGDALEFFVEFSDDQGVPLNFTGYVPSAALRASFNSPTVYNFACTLQTGEAEVLNRVRVYLPSSTSKTVPAGDYVWNLQVTAPNGDVRTYLAGDVTVYAEVDA